MAALTVFALCALLPARAAEPSDVPSLPPRPVLGPVALDECAEADLPGEIPADCRGIVLPVTVWAHLEDLADDSRTVRARHQVDVAELAARADRERWWRELAEDTLDEERRRHRRAVAVVVGGAVALAAASTWGGISVYRAGVRDGLEGIR